ncbi:hypothetical protein G9A89_012247 [Geosiphon pyriformis]|nr:hypothetical protein G9A89_012247 [Geosiphon pyriformis]
MGKHKEKSKGGSSSAFAAYLANLPCSENSNFENGKAPLPNNMKASTLLEQIGAERSWYEDQINSDLSILERNRIYTVTDLRILSRESWTQIELLPIVKDLLREAVHRGQPSQDEKYQIKKAEKKALKALKKQEKNEKRDKKENEEIKRSQIVSEEGCMSVESIIIELPESVENKEKDQKGHNYSSPSSESSSCESSDELETKLKNGTSSVGIGLPSAYNSSAPRQNKQIIGNRLRIRTPTGKAYEVDRYCPHKNADLASRGVILGSKLVCTKHNWEFSLDQGGRCVRHGSTINACVVNDCLLDRLAFPRIKSFPDIFHTAAIPLKYRSFSRVTMRKLIPKSINSQLPMLIAYFLLCLLVSTFAMPLSKRDEPGNPTNPSNDADINYSGSKDNSTGKITTQDTIFGIVLISLGIIYCFFGRKFYSVTFFLVGFYVGGLISLVILSNAEPADKGYGKASDAIYIVVPLLAGLLFGSLFAFFSEVAIWALGALGGYVLAVFILSLSENGLIASKIGRIVFILAIVIISVSLSIFFQNIIIILGTSLIGSYSIIAGIDLFAKTGFLDAIRSFMDGNHHIIYNSTVKIHLMLVGVVGLFILGSIIQWRYHRGPFGDKKKVSPDYSTPAPAPKKDWKKSFRLKG